MTRMIRKIKKIIKIKIYKNTKKKLNWKGKNIKKKIL